jgi:hypothetical protein
MATISANICIRRDTAANWTSNNPTLLTGEMCAETDTGKFKVGTGTVWTSTSYSGGSTNFLATGTGATSRTLDSKLRDMVSVKDFGAVGDGTTDDRAAIQAAIDSCITLDRTLFFPNGVYAMSSFTDSASGIQVKVVTPANALRMEGDSATIKSTNTTQAAYMFYIQGSVGKDLSLKGLTFDANLKSQDCFRHDDQLQGAAVVEIDNCVFQNGFGIQNGVPVGAGFWKSSVGLELLGGYKFINLTNSEFTNFKRDPLTASTDFETAGVGIGVNTNGGTFYPQNTNVSGCYFNDINNNQTAAVSQNANADGLKIFGGLVAGASYIASTATISNNHFINCQGRAIKVQNDEAVITGNTVRYAVRPINGGSGQINCQLECGIVSNNVFHYDAAPAVLGVPQNPFANAVGGVGSAPIGFFPQVATTRARMLTVCDNIVLNNVLEATGILENFTGWSETTPTALPVFMTLTGNKISGPLKVFATPCTRNSLGICSSVIQNNMMTKLTHAFLASSTGCTFALNKFEVSGNVNATATAKPHLVSTSDYTTVLTANFNASRNQNIGVTANLLNQNEKAFLPRVGTIVDPAYGYGGGISVQSQIVEDDATYAFPAITYQTNGASMRMLTSSWGGATNFLFLHGDGTLTSVSAGAKISLTTNVDDLLNVYIDAGLINIKNRLGSSRVFTLFTLG